MIDVDRLAVLIAARIHGLPVTLTAGIAAPLGQRAGVIVGELELPLIDLAQCPGITLVGKAAELLDGVPAPALGVAHRGCRSA